MTHIRHWRSFTVCATALTFALFLFSLPVAHAGVERVGATNTKGGVPLSVPAHAVQVADNVFYLGASYDAGTRKTVDGYMIVHRQAGARPTENGAKAKPTTSCYTYLASGAKWKTVEPWVVNPTNAYGMSNASIYAILTNSVGKWEDAANGVLGDSVGVDVLGSGDVTLTPLVADETTPDDKNEVYFGPLDPGTIGVTIVWGIFGGAPQNRQLIEWDQVYNTYYDWSDSGISSAMDFENIATHELGHSFGLGDLYSASCATETMYGYSTEGDTSKRTLEAGDILGINKLY